MWNACPAADAFHTINPCGASSSAAPFVETANGKAYLRSRIELGEVYKNVDFIVDEQYAEYLCFERSDAFLIGILNLAMRERCDICCEAPVSRELLHQLRTELIPILCKYDHALYHAQIEAEAEDTPLPCAGKIGTGCSCGVDSLYAIQSLSGKADYSVDYLVLNNVGAYTNGGTTQQVRYRQNADNAQAFAREYGYKLIVTDSNFAEAFPQEHLYTHLYSSVFAIYAMRKLWRRYYYASSGCDLQDYFSLRDNHWHDAAKYDLIALPAFSISSLRICNQGMGVSRYEKIRSLADYQPAMSHLNVCLRQGKGSCCECAKCLRTMWILDSMGKLENFAAVFNVGKYRENYSHYMKLLYKAHLTGAAMIDEAYENLKEHITPGIRRRAELELRLRLPGPFRKMARQLKKKFKRYLKHT